MTNHGVFYVAIGDNAKREYEHSKATLEQHNPNLASACYTDPMPSWTNAQASRLAKLSIMEYSPFCHTLYLDADTRVFGDVSLGFDMLVDGWDLLMAPSSAQDKELLWHTGEQDRNDTIEMIGFGEVLQLQAGVFFVAKNDRTRALFDQWRAEWFRHKSQDQGALLRALYEVPVKLGLLGRAWNDHRRGKRAVIEHWFGRAR